ncbi:hypothetical protein CEXT_215481 [Caerostris extrusa]|uniref:Uncharacterized protein n=1 Tax=Caerostris extrusa TaxID=172846 RepID=A0AAV4PD18_CAEEX|nr:hypothetical protein CEXT_215481 [Caerostris extrusa]
MEWHNMGALQLVSSSASRQKLEDFFGPFSLQDPFSAPLKASMAVNAKADVLESHSTSSSAKKKKLKVQNVVNNICRSSYFQSLKVFFGGTESIL